VSRRPHSVRHLLLLSHVVVILVVTAVGFVTVRLVTPVLFDRDLRGYGGLGASWRGDGAVISPFIDMAAVSDSLDRSLSVAAASAAGVGMVLAVLAGWLLSRGLAGRLSPLVTVTHRMADGEHGVRVAIPPEPELADLAGSINRLAASLEATERIRAGMISDLAHEIRNPLTTIQGSMEGLIDGIIGPTPETFASVAEEADRLRRLTDDLSLLARSQEGTLSLRVVQVDLADLVRTVANQFAPSAELEGVDLLVDTGSAGVGSILVRGDPDRLVQVVSNLVGNAITHTPRGEAITLAAGRDETTGRAVLTVSDSGSGIPEDQLDTVFERYTRLDHQHPGTGIGLNIARGLVQAHGGKIGVASPGLGEGTTFTVELPQVR
jgi:signal transduction histidine kinase